MMQAPRWIHADSAVAMAYHVLAEGSFSFRYSYFVGFIYLVSSLLFLHPRQHFPFVRQMLSS